MCSITYLPYETWISAMLKIILLEEIIIWGIKYAAFSLASRVNVSILFGLRISKLVSSIFARFIYMYHIFFSPDSLIISQGKIVQGKPGEDMLMYLSVVCISKQKYSVRVTFYMWFIIYVTWESRSSGRITIRWNIYQMKFSESNNMKWFFNFEKTNNETKFTVLHSCVFTHVSRAPTG